MIKVVGGQVVVAAVVVILVVEQVVEFETQWLLQLIDCLVDSKQNSAKFENQ